MGVRIRDGETILFIGDSITDCGRAASERPLGNGYVKMLSDLVMIREPGKRVRVVNKGISGDTALGLRWRWHDDVLRVRPDWLSVKIGINDLHRVLRKQQDALPPAFYRECYDEVLTRTREALPKCRILLIDPFYISTETSPTSFRRQVLDLIPEYLDVVDALSRKFKTRHVRTHEVFQRLLRHHEPDVFCPEPVHPNPTGHRVIAEAVYTALA